MATKDYEGDGIVVHWDAERCAHSGNCVGGLPDVFDTQARPWINPADTAADRIAAAVDACPSRALTYTRTDGAPGGTNARTVADDTPA
ncbi:MAG: (4Fe-4S)-binding protein [Microthrixaceae bacterium]